MTDLTQSSDAINDNMNDYAAWSDIYGLFSSGQKDIASITDAAEAAFKKADGMGIGE